MTTPQLKPPAAWSRLSGSWFTVNLGIPLLVILLLLGRSSFTRILSLVALALLLGSNLRLAWLISERRIGPCIAIFLGSSVMASALIFAGIVMLFLTGALGPHWG